VSQRDRDLEFAQARAARRLAKLHPKDFQRLTIEELAKTLNEYEETP
jgi:hypothetical protein